MCVGSRTETLTASQLYSSFQACRPTLWDLHHQSSGARQALCFCWHLLCVIPCTPQSAKVGVPADEWEQTCCLPVLQHVQQSFWRLEWPWLIVPLSSFANAWTSEAGDSELNEVASSKAGF